MYKKLTLSVLQPDQVGTNSFPRPKETKAQGDSRQKPIEISDSDGESDAPAPRQDRTSQANLNTFKRLKRLPGARHPYVSRNESAVAEYQAVPANSTSSRTIRPRRIKTADRASTIKIPVGNIEGKVYGSDDDGCRQRKRALESPFPNTMEPHAKRRAIEQFLVSPVSPGSRPAAFGSTKLQNSSPTEKVPLVKLLSTTNTYDITGASPVNHRGSSPSSQTSEPSKTPSASLRPIEIQEQERDKSNKKTPDESNVITRLKREMNERRKLDKDLLFTKSQLESLEEQVKGFRGQLVAFVKREFQLFEITRILDPLSMDEVNWFRESISKVVENSNGPPHQENKMDQLCQMDTLYNMVHEIQTRVNLNLSSTFQYLGEEITSYGSVSKR